MFSRKRAAVLGMLFAFALVVSACGSSEDTTTTAAADTTIAGNPAITACQVTDTGGIDDKSFNQTAWKGVTDAIAAGLATEDSDYVESQVETDYAPNIQAMLDRNCDLIITVGYLLGDATATAATDYPDQLFEILDYAYDPPMNNVIGTVFTTDQAAFLAGYLAAGVTKTGKVATYGGIAIPGAVTDFMDGFVWGVDYYNQQKGTSVEVLGWDVASQSGSFTGDFESLDNGRSMTQSLIDEGADVILP
ncbi:MAG: BMP family ABC transporter substrate-binding protein, partial [Acidimicrobiia bacterium]